jgi:hypothetical protein
LGNSVEETPTGNLKILKTAFSSSTLTEILEQPNEKKKVALKKKSEGLELSNIFSGIRLTSIWIN